MPDQVMVMLAECTPGSEEAFDDWYTNTHLPQILSVEGFVAAQRFELASLDPAQEGAARYLAIYEIEGDVQTAFERLRADAPNRVDGAPLGLDRSRSKGAYYVATTERMAEQATREL